MKKLEVAKLLKEKTLKELQDKNIEGNLAVQLSNSITEALLYPLLELSEKPEKAKVQLPSTEVERQTDTSFKMVQRIAKDLRQALSHYDLHDEYFIHVSGRGDIRQSTLKTKIEIQVGWGDKLKVSGTHYPSLISEIRHRVSFNTANQPKELSA